MKYEIKSIGLWSFVKISFFLNLALGFVLGFVVTPLLAVWFSVMKQMTARGQVPSDLSDAAPGIAFLAVPVFLSLSMAVFNTFFGAIGIILYNLIARLIGGFEMSLDEVDSAVPVSSASAQASVSAYGAPPPPPMAGATAAIAMAPALPKPELPASKFE